MFVVRLKTCAFRGCRHKLFSDHFGEKAVTCKNMCDICKNKKGVEEIIELFHIKSIQYSTAISSSDVSFDDLYGGGRKGMNV